jgi:hypothetical protein
MSMRIAARLCLIAALTAFLLVFAKAQIEFVYAGF